MNQVVIGLAGHIDHGKTALVKALTGINTDNLIEEKKRGMTIDIGFAFLSEKVTMIDVPGHERFVKNMMAGISSIDIALLVVAADDGIMPQTREHFEILNLLNISKGIVAINKVDLVDDEWLELIQLDVMEMCKGTFMENAPLALVSAEQKKGIKELKNLLFEQCDSVPQKYDRGIFRQNIDRVFSITGYGTIVTGTVISGHLNIGEKIEIIPGGIISKVRNLQSHGKNVNSVYLGDRAAINLAGIETTEIKRGSQLATPGFFRSVNEIGVKVQVLKTAKRPIIQNQRIRIHLGTQEEMARIALINNKEIKPGSECPALIRFESPMVASIDDKFIIRSYSPIITIGGGMVLDNHIEGKWKQIKDKILQLYNHKDLKQIIQLIEQQDINPFTVDSLKIRLGISEKRINKFIENTEELFWLEHKHSKWIFTHSQMSLLKNRIKNQLVHFHKKNPLSIGMQKEEIRQKINSTNSILEALLEVMFNEKMINKKGEVWLDSSFTVKLDKEDLKIQIEIIDLLSEQGFMSSSLDEISKKINFDKKKLMRIMTIAEKEGKILRVDGNLMFTKQNFDMLKDKVINHFIENDLLSVSEFKVLAKTSRKYAVPLLEFFDKEKITYREGNCRRLIK